MCTSPITIRNPYYDNIPADAGYRRFCPSSPTIQVPCGHCPDCQKSKTSSMVQRCIIEAQTSHVFNITLTYNPEHLPIAEYQSLQSGQIVKVPYFDITHLQNMFKRLRKLQFPQNRCFRYFAVSEYGGTYHRPHAHLLLFVSRISGETPADLDNLCRFLYDNILANWSVNVGTKFQPVYEPLCTPRTVVKNGKTYTNYQCKLVTPLEELPDGTKRPISDYAKYLKALSDPTFVVQYLCKYLYKSDQFSVNISKFLHRNTVLSDNEEFLPVDSLARYYKTVATIRLCSKGLGFGFDPTTGKKVYIIGRNNNLKPTLSRILSDSTKQELKEYISEPFIVESIENLLVKLDCFASKSRKLLASDFLVQLSDEEYRIFDLALLTNHRFRYAFHVAFPKYQIPPRVELPASTLTDKVSDYTIFGTLEHVPQTASVLAIRDVLNSADNPTYNYPVFSLHGFRASSLSSYYRSFLTLDFWEDFYNKRNIKDFDTYISALSSSSALSHSALVEECFMSDSRNRHKEHPYMKPLPYDIDFFASSDVYVFSKSEHNRYLASVHRYELQYY